MNVLDIPGPTATALLDEGIDDFEDFVTMRDDAAIRLVNNCRKTWKPPRPNAGPALEAWQRQRAGLHIPEIYCTRIRQLAFYCMHLDRTDRVFQATGATLDILQELWTWR
jgi:hypothetical protein